MGWPDECLPSAFGFPRLSLFLDGEGIAAVMSAISASSAASVCLFAGPLRLPTPCAWYAAESAMGGQVIDAAYTRLCILGATI